MIHLLSYFELCRRAAALLPRLAPLLVLLAAPARAVEIQLGAEFAQPGDVVSFAVRLNSEGDEIVGFQNDIVFDARTAIETRSGRPDCDVNPDIQRGGTNFAFVNRPCNGEPCSRMRAVVFSFTSLEPIADGALLYVCRVRVASDAIEGAYPLFCPADSVEAADADSNAVPSSCREGAIVVRRATPAPGETPVYDPNEARGAGLPCEADAQCVSGSCVTRVCGGGGETPTPSPSPTASKPPPPTATPTASGPSPTPSAAPQATRGLPTPQPQATNTPFSSGGACAIDAADAGGAGLLWLLALAPLLARRRRARALCLLSVALLVAACGSADDDRDPPPPTAVATATATPPAATATATLAVPSATPITPAGAATSTALAATATPRAVASFTPTRSATPSATATRTGTPTPSRSATPSATATPTFAGVEADALSGGETTVFDATRNAFGQPARNLPLDRRSDFFVGNAFFNRNWVTAPSSNTGLDGLGPVFNARSCSSCHPRDGRGRPPLSPAEAPLALLFRLSVPGADTVGAPLPEPSYGGQLGPMSILGVPAEGRVVVTYEELTGAYDDGDSYTLRRPHYEFADLAFGPLAEDALFSPRVGPAVFGVGLLEAIPQQGILAAQDPEDLDGDGISGRVNTVWDRRAGAFTLGRFGWKANVPTLEQQTAGAFLGDIGLTSELFPDQDCPPPQSDCAAAPNGGTPEIDADKVDFISFYMRRLAVPARRAVRDPTALRGEELFAEIGCESCHRATWTTAADAPPELAAQTIHPYTDLLLHDMGEDLADGRPDFDADGSEWRTPPLWGIGLLHTVNDHTFLLHDGRARDTSEAILWHGGEAAASRDLFRALPREERAALLRFLESL